MMEPGAPVGFNYSLAILHILKVRTYQEVADFLGYESVGSIGNIINGRVPNHPQGEAIFVLYRQLFGRKPPMTNEQAAGEPDLHKRECDSVPSTA